MEKLRYILAMCLRGIGMFPLAIGVLLFALANAVQGSNSLDYRAYANAMEVKYELPTNLLVAICDYENRGKVWRNVAGAHGEIGVCQIKPDTVRMLCGDCTQSHGNVVYGEIGNEVRVIQSKLGIKVDGIFGPQTLEAVLNFQNYHHLRADGVVGANTWKALTGKSLVFKSISDQLWEPRANIEYAAKYLVWLRNYLGEDISLLIAGYNGGPAHPLVTYVRKVNEIRRVSQ